MDLLHLIHPAEMSCTGECAAIPLLVFCLVGHVSEHYNVLATVASLAGPFLPAIEDIDYAFEYLLFFSHIRKDNPPICSNSNNPHPSELRYRSS